MEVNCEMINCVSEGCALGACDSPTTAIHHGEDGPSAQTHALRVDDRRAEQRSDRAIYR